MPRFGAIHNSSNPVRIFGPSVCISVPLFYSIRLISLISADLVFWRDLIFVGWGWIDHFFFRFYKNGCLICEMKCTKRIMTVCKQAYRNLKLQTNKPLYLVGPQKIKKKVWVQRQWMAWQENLYHFWGILNCFLPTMVASGVFHLVIYFPNIYHSGEEGALITFVYIQIRHPSHSSPSVFGQHFWRPGLLWLGGKQNRPAPKDNPCSIIFRCGVWT